MAGQMGLLGTRQVAGFEGNTVAGGDKIGPGAEGGADDMKGVADVSTEGRITETAATKEVVTHHQGCQVWHGRRGRGDS